MLNHALSLQMEELEVMEAPMEWYTGVALTVAAGGAGVAAGYGLGLLVAFT